MVGQNSRAGCTFRASECTNQCRSAEVSGQDWWGQVRTSAYPGLHWSDHVSWRWGVL